MSVDEGERKNFKDLIPILFQGEVMDFIITEQPMYGSLMDSSDIEIEQFSSGWFPSLSLVQTTSRPLPLIGQLCSTNQRG